jgi:hypothetical protein
MIIHVLKERYKVYKGETTAEKKYRNTLSKILIDKYGKGPFNQDEVRKILNTSYDIKVLAKLFNLDFANCVKRGL